MLSYSCSNFRIRSLWKVGSTTTNLYLSGAGTLQKEFPIKLPRDENKMILLKDRKIDPKVQSMPEEQMFISSSSFQFAFTMHERCWQLIIRFVDKDLIKQNMDLFVQAMYEQKLRPHMLNQVTQARLYWLRYTSQLDPSFCAILGDVIHIGPSQRPDIDHQIHKIVNEDPLNGPHVKWQFSNQMSRHEEKMNRSNPRPRYLITTHKMKRRSQFAFKATNIFIPAEIICMITDYLETNMHIRTFLLVYPEWHSMTLDSNWRCRFRDENLMRNEKLPAADAINWQYSYLNSDKLLEDSWGWKNRLHILIQLRKIKTRFLQTVGQMNEKGGRSSKSTS